MNVSHLHSFPKVLGQRAVPLRTLAEAERDIERTRARSRLRHLRVGGKPIDPDNPIVATLPRPPKVAGSPRPETVAAAKRASVVHIAEASPARPPRWLRSLRRLLRRRDRFA